MNARAQHASAHRHRTPSLLAHAAGWVLALGLTAITPWHAIAAPTETLTVFAAASLTEAFTAIGARYQRAHPGTAVRFNFAGSQQLAAQLEQGAAADVFAPADEQWMRFAAAEAGISGAPQTFARNRLVVIVPRSNPARIRGLADLTRPGVKLVIGAATVPVGTYARATLERLDGRPGFGAGWARRALANVVSEEENVKGVVGKVQLGEADAGIVYGSDVTRRIVRRVSPLAIPDDANTTAVYTIAVMAAAKHPDAARAFIDLVRSKDGQAILVHSGFLPDSAATP